MRGSTASSGLSPKMPCVENTGILLPPETVRFGGFFGIFEARDFDTVAPIKGTVDRVVVKTSDSG